MRMCRTIRPARRPASFLVAGVLSLLATLAMAAPASAARVPVPVAPGFSVLAAEVRGAARPVIVVARADVAALPARVAVAGGVRSIGANRWAVLVVVARTGQGPTVAGLSRVRVGILGGRRLTAVHHFGTTRFGRVDRLPNTFAPRNWSTGQLLAGPGRPGTVLGTGRNLIGMVAGGMTFNLTQAEAGFFGDSTHTPPVGMVWIVVELEGTGSGDVVTTTPGDIDCDIVEGQVDPASDCEHYYYVQNVYIGLNEAAARQSLFNGWGGDMGSCGNATSCSVPINVERRIVAKATFIPQM